MSKPTIEQFTKYQCAYDYFNRVLFDDELTPCLLVFRDAARKKNAVCMGHFGPHRWEGRDGELCHEISLNPLVLRRPLAQTFGTLVHEMCHQWQADHGTPSRGGYHNGEWAAKMEAVGLIPSNTGEPGGRKTGQSVTHYVEEGGRFAEALDAMPESIALPWLTGESLEGLRAAAEGEPKEPKTRNKIKYTCECGVNIWGKPDLRAICGDCSEEFAPVES